MATKINKLLQILPSNALMFSSWMSTQGISRAEQSSCVQTGWLEKLAHGVYYNRGGKPTYSAKDEPLTREQYIATINRGIAQCETGECTTHEDLIKELKTWK